MVNIFKHRCRYKIVGTGFIGSSKMILCDLICPKCGKVGTVYVDPAYKDEVLKIASGGEYFNIPRAAVFTEREFMNYIAVNDL